MRAFLGVLLVLLWSVVNAQAGDFDPNGRVQPSLESRVKDSAFIVLTSVEVRHGFIAYKVLETWKGKYDSRNFPNQYKGYFTDYTKPKDYYQDHPKHALEIRFSGRGENVISPAKSQPDPASVIFNPSIIYPDKLQLPVIKNTVDYPLRIRGGDEKVLEDHLYSFQEIKALIQKLVDKG